jgi:hypothetical protein
VLPFLRRLNAWFAIVFFAVALFEVRRFLAVFTADSLTHGTAAVVILAMIFFLIPNARMRRVGSGLLGLGLIAYAGRIAGTHPAGYYDDSLARAGVASAPFAWLRETRPQRVIAWSFRSGPVDIVTPHTDVIENYSGNACAAARQANALLLAIDDGNEPPDARTIARSCGHVVFESAAALIVQP